MMPLMQNVGRQSLSVLLDGYAAPLTSNQIISNISLNSQTLREGGLFIALDGLSQHAIDFAGEAIKSGAVAVAYDSEDSYSQQRIKLLQRQYSVEWVAIKKLKSLAGKIASRFYGHPSQHLKLIGVTGTDGKTSVTHLLVQSLIKLNKRAGSIGTLGYGMNNVLHSAGLTTPDAIQLQSNIHNLKEQGCEYVVMEVSSHALHQYRVSGCQFDLALLTNLGSDHLDYHHNIESYAKAKQKLFDFTDLSNRVFNINDKFGLKLSSKYPNETVTTYSASKSEHENVNISIESEKIGLSGLQLILGLGEQKIEIDTDLIGKFNIDNLLATAAVLTQLGFSNDEIEYAMQGLSPIPGRMEYYPSVDNGSQETPAIVIDFAHTEQALTACLEAIRPYCQGSLICIFGCGGDRDAGKRPQMAKAAENYSDRVIVTDDNPRYEDPKQIVKDIVRGFNNPDQVEVIHNRKSAIKRAVSSSNSNDLIVIAGKGHEQEQIIKGSRIPFSDGEVVANLLRGDSDD